MECKDRNNRSAVMLPYKFLPSMAAENLRDAAEKVFFKKKKGIISCFLLLPITSIRRFLHSSKNHDTGPNKVASYCLIAFET